VAAIQYLESAGKVAGQIDYQRLATLYLRAGDTEKSLQTWKKLAEQHGGAFGHAQAIRALSGSGAHGLLTPYLKEVFASMPASDPARHQLAESIIQINEDSGRYDSLIDSEIFSTEMKTTADLAQRYAGDLGNLPGLARRRIEPIAARFPENHELQAFYADTLQKSGDVAGAIVVYKKLPQDAEFYRNFGHHFGMLLREGGDIDAWREFVLDRVRRPNPLEGDVMTASRALIESGRREELAAFREEVLANSEPGQHGRLRAGFAKFDAERGDVAGAHATLKALAEEIKDSAIQARYLEFLIVRGFQAEAEQLYTQWPEEVREAVFQDVRSRGVLGALLASGNTEAAWKELMRRVLRREGGHDPGGHQIAQELRALGDFCNHVVPASVVDGYLDAIRKQPVLSKTDRFVLAWWEINRGHWPAALEIIGDYREARMFQDLIELSKELVPQDLRQELLNRPIAEPASPQPAASSEAEAAPAPPEATPQSRIEAARELADNGKAQEAVALLDAVAILNTDTDILQRRAEAYRAANAPDKAVADLTALLAQRPDYRNVRMELAACLALAGKPAEAMAAWREAGQPVNTEFAGVLLDKSLFAEALEVLGAAGTQGGWAVDVALLRARALQGTGQIEEMIMSLEAVYQDLSTNGQEDLVLRIGTQLQQSAAWQALLDMESLKANTFLNHVLLSMTRNMNPDDAASLRAALIGRVDPGAITRRDDAEHFAIVLRAAEQRDKAIAVLAAAAKLPGTQRYSDRVLVDAMYNLDAPSEAAGLLIEVSRTDPMILTHDPAYGLYRAEELEDPIMRDALFDRIIELAPTDALATYVTALKTWYGPDKAVGQAALVAFADAPEAQSPQLFRLADLFREQGEEALALKCLERLAGGDFGDEVQDRALLTQISFKQKAGDPAGALEVFARLLPAPLPMRSQAWQEIATYFGELPYETVEPLIVAMIQANPEHPGVADLVALRTALAVKHKLPVPALDPAGLGVPAAREAELRLFGNLITTWAASDIAETNNWSEMARELDNETVALLRGDDVPLPPSREWRALGAGDSYPSLLVGRMSGGFSGAWGIRGASEFLVKLESPDVRTVTLAIGSSDQIRLWVNEGEVYSNRSGRLNLLDTDRVEVALKQGTNWVFVRCRHGEEVNSGVFSLSIVSGAEGLRVLMPSLPVHEEGRTEVQAAQ
jgi:tetratricopeptide (TPR) repeat protein